MLDLPMPVCSTEIAEEPHKPGVTVQGFSSRGQMWRVYSHTTGDVHHYFSKLEYSVHALLDLNPYVIDIKDQYKHDLNQSLATAFDLGINHPPQKDKDKKPLTTDFLVTFAGRNGQPSYTIAIYVKYVEEFRKWRTAEKLELEIQSLRTAGVPLFIVSEDSIDKLVMKNIEWLLTVTTDQLVGECNKEYAEKLLHQIHQTPEEKLTTALLCMDQRENMPDGFHLTEVKCLMQFGFLSFDLDSEALFLNCSDIELVTLE